MSQNPWMIERGVVGINPSLNMNRQGNGKQQYSHQSLLQQHTQLQQTPHSVMQQHQKQNQFLHHPQHKFRQQQQQQQQQQNNQHQIPETRKPQHPQLLNHQQHLLHNYHQMQPQSSTSTNLGTNPSHSSFLAKTPNFHSHTNQTQNFENNINSFPFPNDHQNVADIPKVTNPSSKNEDALQQLKNNLSLVLHQQKQREKLSKPQRGRHLSSLQAKYHQSYPVSSNGSTAPSLTEESLSVSNMKDNRNSNALKQPSNQHQPSPQQLRPQVPSLPSRLSPLPPSNASGLFALGDDFQPLSSSDNTKDLNLSQKALPRNNTSLMGSWSGQIAPQAVDNDILMNNLFHAELKSSREKKGNEKQNISKVPSSTALNASQQGGFQLPSTMDKTEMEQLFSTPFPAVDNLSSSQGPTKAPPSNSKTKKPNKKKSKDGVSKKTQKRKSTKRKPKFPLLEKDPPIEDQISALPVIAFAPSLLARLSTTNGPGFPSYIDGILDGNDAHQTMINGHQRKQKRSETSITSKIDEIPPTETFQNILKSRGHDENYFVDLEGTKYEVTPSPLQLASYGSYLVWATQSSNTDLVRTLLGSGLSPNPCNQFRDSILGDLVCKQGNLSIYKCFVEEFNADLRVVDGFGRTFLHHCCWAHELCRPMVEDILTRDPVQIFLKDKQEKTALEYVSPDAYGAWNDFLNEVADTYWPTGCKLPDSTFPFSGRLVTGDLMDPPNALSPQLAEGVASGKITPKEALTMKVNDSETNGKA